MVVGLLATGQAQQAVTVMAVAKSKNLQSTVTSSNRSSYSSSSGGSNRLQQQ